MGVKCTVTWGKEVFKDVEVDTSQTPETFKFQLYSLTGVPPERQKIMGLKGGLLKDSAEWSKVGLKPGQKLMLMGSADKVGCLVTAALRTSYHGRIERHAGLRTGARGSQRRSSVHGGPARGGAGHDRAVQVRRR